ncbi:hypothetical protein RQP53_03665 [Paucibacter sp. APW11]|uniref:Uncharacterized protein n=1 Tax=Roseateles aquae TaxID=3077235 RepID=A0ABU3P735_9BURK|nr:hypothetical protein [Paucibacter sp. APW11]MDT8998371.1 hypothetical protein [Paucibacter sp. APW11]
MPHHHKRHDRRDRFAHAAFAIPLEETPLGIALNQAATLLPAERALITEPMQAAFDALRAAQGDASQLAHIIDAINIGNEIARRYQIASDHQATRDAAQAAVIALLERAQATGRWTLRGAEIAAFDDALWIFSVQLQFVSRGELATCTRVLKARARSALAGNTGPGVRVFNAPAPSHA